MKKGFKVGLLAIAGVALLIPLCLMIGKNGCIYYICGCAGWLIMGYKTNYDFILNRRGRRDSDLSKAYVDLVAMIRESVELLVKFTGELKSGSFGDGAGMNMGEIFRQCKGISIMCCTILQNAPIPEDSIKSVIDSLSAFKDELTEAMTEEKEREKLSLLKAINETIAVLSERPGGR